MNEFEEQQRKRKEELIIKQENLYLKSEALINLNRYEEAIECLDNLLVLNPTCVPALNAKGNALMHLNRFDDAIKCFEKAIKSDPDDAILWNNLAESYLNMAKTYLNSEELEIIEQDTEEREEDIFVFDLDEYMSEWKKSESNLNADISNVVNQRNYDTISFKLLNIHNNSFVEKKLPINKSYFTFDDINNIDDAKELKPSELKSGDYIIIVDNDEKKSLLNLVVDLYNLKDIIDMGLIEYWKLEFLNYVESNNLKYREVYNLYCNSGGDKTYQTVLLWCKGEPLGPQSEKDLYLIGKIINDDFILKNYSLMFQQINLMRRYHRKIGRQLKKMIKSILNDGFFDDSSLNENENLIYESIQNGIYKID